MLKRWNIAIAGFGSVGYHAAEQLCSRLNRYQTEYQADVRLVAVCGSKAGLYDPDGLSWQRLQPLAKANGGLQAAADASAEHTGAQFLAASGADILIEAGPTDYETGGPAYEHLSMALSRGMHAIAISKGALVKDYPGLAKLAREHGAMLKISGATAAALPTIDLLQYNLAGCEVSELTGIFTGTTNFILTRMLDEGVPFASALAEAQRLGIAEPDPRFDLEGWDTACKLTILANAAFDAGLRLHDVSREGIEWITPEQITAWREAQVVPKLVGRLARTGRGITAGVKIDLFPLDHPFSQVKGTTKAIQVTTDVMGELLVIGGKSDPRAAAAAALKDLEHILRFN